MEVIFLYTIVTARGNIPDGKKPDARKRTLKTEHHSPGTEQWNFRNSRPGHKEGGVAEKANESVCNSTHRGVFQPPGVEDKQEENLTKQFQSHQPGYRSFP